MVHVRVLADKRIDDMEKTMSIFAEQVARLECELNSLESIDGDNVCDKVRLTTQICFIKCKIIYH